MKIITYNYMWTTSDEGKIFTKIFTDIEEGHETFVKTVQENVPDLRKLGREYVCEYDTDFVGKFEELLQGVKSISESEMAHLVSGEV